MRSMRRVARATRPALASESSGGARDTPRTPLLEQEMDDGKGEDSDSSVIDSPLSNRDRATSGPGRWFNGRRDRQQQQPSTAGGDGGIITRRSAVSPFLRWTNSLPPPPPPRGDYRSEGEQPFTERNGERRLSGQIRRQESFRTNRMPKRGGRKRLRRDAGQAAAARRRRIKIRVSSYCVARGLETLDLLRWLESQPNRRLSQACLAEGRSMVNIPLARQGEQLGNLGATRDGVGVGVGVGVDVDDVEAADPSSRGGGGATSTAAPGPGGAVGGAGGGGGEEGAAVGPGAAVGGGRGGGGGGGGGGGLGNGLDWMDSLYLDVIHSTTDIRGGLRKARDLERSALGEDGYMDGEEGVDDFGGITDEERGDSGGGGRGGAGAGGGGKTQQEQEGGAGGDGDVDAPRHKDIMFFPYGAVVFWGFSIAEEKEVLLDLTRFMVGKVSDNELAQSVDDMSFVYRHHDGRRGAPLKNDEITLDTSDPAEKLAYSCALAQSSKLFVFEERLDSTIELTAKYPEMLAATGKIPLTEAQIGRLVGRVLCEQNEVNLHSDILDTPEYFWEEDTWEPAYQALCAYLDIPLRLDNLNKRLEILKELLNVLGAQSTTTHATRLEYIIICLICVEVIIEIVWNIIIKDILQIFG